MEDRGIAGQLLCALAASKPRGTFLCLGEGAGGAATWILDGMDLSSGLVVLVRAPEEGAALEPELERDLRVSVHRQDAQGFLRDIHAHRFDLIADLVDGEHAAVARLGLHLLRPGGFYVASRAGATLQAAFAPGALASDPSVPQLAADAFSIAQLDATGDVTLVARRTERPAPRRRSR